jgi:NADH-quinone oxidoreductase subunit J
MSASRLIFDLAGAIAFVFAGIMVANRNPVKGLLALVVSFFALAVAFVMLSAPFLAAVQVIVYAGAILVLFLFVTMLLNLEPEAPSENPRPVQKILASLGIVAFAALLLAAINSSGSAVAVSGAPPATGEIGPLARELFTTDLLPFEAVSVLLLAALTGASVLARREKAPPP